jgi:hypothetical protein
VEGVCLAVKIYFNSERKKARFSREKLTAFVVSFSSFRV